MIDHLGLGKSWRLLVVVPALLFATLADSLVWGLTALMVTVGVVLATRWARGAPPNVHALAAIFPLLAWICAAWAFALEGTSVDEALVEAPALIAFGLGAGVAMFVTRRAPR